MAQDPNASTSQPAATQSGPAGVPYIVMAPPAPAPQPKQRGVLGKFLAGMALSLLVLSVISNLYLIQIIGILTRGPHEVVEEPGDKEQRIVILPIEGVITGNTERFVKKSLDEITADKDNMPKALILRVESPGGYVGPSDRILHLIKKFQADNPGIPVLASFGSVAASGGYYVAASCDHITAEPTCTTGSIGVIMAAMTYGKLMENIGIDAKVFVADGSPKKDVANNPFRAINEADEVKIKQLLNTTHEQFVSVVAQGRKAVLKPEEAKALANGETYSTKQAIANKLIDGEGYLDDVIARAKTVAKISGTPRVTRIEGARGLGFFGAGMQEGMSLPKSGEELRTWIREASLPRMEYLWTPGM